MVYTTEEAEKDIVSFDQALELCSIGFNKSTFCHYTIETRQLCLSSLDEDGLYMPDKDIAAPTKSQVFRWFREKYDYHHTIQHNKKYIGIAYSSVVNFSIDEFNTYEEAENACIDQLILLAKQQDK